MRFDLDFRPKWPAPHLSSPSSLGCWIRLDCSEQVPDGYADRRGLLFNLVNGHRITQTLFVENTLKAGRESFTRLHHLYAYGRKEHQEGEYLQLEEYAPAFLSWATNYLSRDPAFIISAGSSLDGEIIQKIDTQTSIARKKQEQQKTQMFSNEKYELQSFDGKPVVVHLNGTVKLTKRLPQKPLRFHINS